MTAHGRLILIDAVARIGYTARGVVYGVVGAIAIWAALTGFRPQGTEGALREIASMSFGGIALVLIFLGLLSFSAWRAVQALLDFADDGRGLRGIVVRSARFFSAGIYGFLAISAADLAWGAPERDGGTLERVAVFVFFQPFGRALLIVGAFGVMVAGIAHVVGAVKGVFDEHLALPKRYRRMFLLMAQAGLAVKGLLLIAIGSFLGHAALTFSPGKAKGTAAVLDALQAQVFGGWLLLAVGIGLAFYAAYAFIQVIFRRAVDT